jgi:hypothetical protein
LSRTVIGPPSFSSARAVTANSSASGASGGTCGWSVEEFASADLDGKPLDVSKRNPAAKQLTVEQAATPSAANSLAGSDGWNPNAEGLRAGA